MKPYPDWRENTPHTNKNSRVRRLRKVANKRVIHVINASYRGSTFSGTFELENQSGDPVQVTPKGKSYARVICAWHGVTPRTEYPGLDLSNAKYKLDDDFTGEVADDIR